MNGSPEVRFMIEPLNKDYDSNDDRWMDQVSDLVSGLEENAGKVHQERQLGEGNKGGLAVLELILGSVGAINSAVDMFKAWIARDQNRELVLSIEIGGETQTYRVSGKRMDKDDIRQFMESAFQGSLSHD